MRTLALLILVLRLAVPAARADDACLEGPSTLGDQRGLATLRAACACDAPGATRRDWIRCGRDAVAALIGDGTLRTACRATALRDVKTATCGSSRVACGLVNPTKPTGPLACKTKNPAGCHDAKTTDATACTEASHCTDVVTWTAGTCGDPRQAGPWGVGVRTVVFTRPSTVNPAVTRTLETLIWYPTTPGAGPVDAAKGGVIDAPLVADGARWPLVMFSHGSCGLPGQSNFLWPLVASRGFIVVAPPHPGNTLLEFPTCGTPTAQLNSAVERPQDIRYVLDQMLLLDADAGSPFFGAVDGTRLAMAGHSFGGWTTYASVTSDARYRAAVMLAPAVPAGPPHVTVPSLTMLSWLDTYVPEAAIRTAFATADAPKYLVELRDAGHFAYSQNCFPSPDCNPPATMTQDEAHAAVLRWVVPFLERYVAGTAGREPFFLQPVPGTVLTAVP